MTTIILSTFSLIVVFTTKLLKFRKCAPKWSFPNKLNLFHLNVVLNSNSKNFVVALLLCHLTNLWNHLKMSLSYQSFKLLAVYINVLCAVFPIDFINLIGTFEIDFFRQTIELILNCTKFLSTHIRGIRILNLLQLVSLLNREHTLIQLNIWLSLNKAFMGDLK